MANGRLAAVTPAINTDALVYQVPSPSTASIIVSVTNCNAFDSNVRLSIENSSAVGIATTNCIEYDVKVAANSTFERGGVVLASQQKLFGRASSANVNFVVYGYEE